MFAALPSASPIVCVISFRVATFRKNGHHISSAMSSPLKAEGWSREKKKVSRRVSSFGSSFKFNLRIEGRGSGFLKRMFFCDSVAHHTVEQDRHVFLHVDNFTCVQSVARM